MRRVFQLLWLPVLLVCLPALGCKSVSWSGYTSPRVTGRVLDSQSRLPLQNVSVHRITADDASRAMEPPKGAQLIQERRVSTDRDGRFALASVRALGPFADSPWWSVSLSFKRTGYAQFSTRYVFAVPTNSVQGEPVVDAGDIMLRPRP